MINDKLPLNAVDLLKFGQLHDAGIADHPINNRVLGFNRIGGCHHRIEIRQFYNHR